MSNLTNFIQQNSLACAGLLTTIAIYLWDSPARAYGLVTLQAANLSQRYNSDPDKTVLLDIRSDESIQKQGCLPHAISLNEVDKQYKNTADIQTWVIVGEAYEDAIETKAIEWKKRFPEAEVCMLEGGVKQWISAGYPVIS